MIFKELGSLVHQQGEMVDSIEAYVENTEISVGMGTTHLRQANQHAVSFLSSQFKVSSLLLLFVV